MKQLVDLISDKNNFEKFNIPMKIENLEKSLSLINYIDIDKL